MIKSTLKIWPCHSWPIGGQAINNLSDLAQLKFRMICASVVCISGVIRSFQLSLTIKFADKRKMLHHLAQSSAVLVANQLFNGFGGIDDNVNGEQLIDDVLQFRHFR